MFNVDHWFWEKICTMTEKQLLDYLEYFLAEKGYNLEQSKWKDNELLYAGFTPPKEKRNNVCLVAHADTVGMVFSDLRITQIDEHSVLFHNGDGYFDDRAGIGGILTLIEDGLYPYVLILGQEEKFCGGAFSLVKDYPDISMLFPHNNISCLIELDRQGKKEVVFYELDYPKFEQLFEGYYCKRAGTWTDISILCPSWNIAGANVSIGYYNQHSRAEILFLQDYDYSLKCVRDIVSNVLVGKERWEYKGSKKMLQFLGQNSKNPPC